MTNGGPVVVITGGLSGIGAATALAFAERKACIVIGDHEPTNADVILAGIASAGGRGIFVEADVRDPPALQHVADRTVEEFGTIDILVAGAGIADQSSSSDGDPARWQTVVDTNLLGTLFAVRAVLPTLLRQGHGHIFVIASLSGRQIYVGEPAYIASKWGQVGFTHALRQELFEHRIRVSLIEPGLVDTPLARRNPMVEDILTAIEPLRPEDIAQTIVYVASQPERVLLSEIAIQPLEQAPF
jgi:NADP-dependent 3-hydroxy acid dehydrogenase YdfG